VVRKGRKILFLEIKELQLKFIVSNSYLDGNEYQIAEQYEIIFEKHFFPIHFNRNSNYNYVGDVPPLEFFLLFNDTSKERKEKEQFVSTLKSQQYIWQFEKEIVRFCDENAWLLTICCLRFIKECFNFQISLQPDKWLSEVTIIHPFAHELCTLPGFVYKVFKYFYLNYEDIYCVKHEFGYPSRNVSKVEHEWASYLEYLHPHKHFQSAFNNAKGQKFFKECIPDLYSPITKEAIFFHGCYFHGHFQNCLSNRHATGETRNAFLNKTYSDLNAEFDYKAFLLKLNNPSIETVKIMWECTYQSQKLNSEKFKHFHENIYKPHPLFRLSPRTAVRGAFLDVFSLKWNQDENPSENFFAFDVNGLYSYCAIKFEFMIGKYEILMGKDLNKIEIRESDFYVDGQLISGTMLVTILPPQNLKYPFLLYRLKNGKTVNTLCVKCAELNSSIVFSQKRKCKHIQNDRAITSTYFISEISFALRLGYTLISIHECHCYRKKGFILKDFVQKLNCLKIQNSDCLKYFESEDEKENYLKFLNEEMELKTPFNLTVTNVTPNKHKKAFYKLMSNALYGKLEQKSNQTKTCYISSQRELENLFFSENTIEEIIPFNENVCQVELKTDELKLKPNLKTNCYLGGQITAYARMVIYNYLIEVVNANGHLFYVDTDCIFFSLPKNCLNPLPISDAVGHFKEVYSNIDSFFVLGPKNYVVKYKENNQVKTTTKIRGISLSSFFLENEITSKTFENYMNQFLNDSIEEKHVNQMRTKRFKSDNLIATNLELLTFTNDINARRLIVKEDSKLSTLPYGYQV
jgi:G:T-mismatch repair DNA endonuclease (very short patch repair protein)